MPKSFSSFFPNVVNRIFGPPKSSGLPQFSEDKVVFDAGEIRVGPTWQHYLHFYANTCAVITTNEGDILAIQRENYPDLPIGLHRLQYVDLRERTEKFPLVAGISKEGYDVWLTVVVNWRVSNPITVIKKADPINTLRGVCEAAIKNLIRSYDHDELVNVLDREQVEDKVLASRINQFINQNQACRGFEIVSIDILERQGDPQVLAIEQRRQLDEKSYRAVRETYAEKQRLIEDEEALIIADGQNERRRAMIETDLEKIRAEFEANKARIIQEAEYLKIELELLRKLPEMQLTENLKALDVRLEAIRALIEAQRAGGFPRNFDDMQIIQQIVSNMPGHPSLASNSVMRLRSTLETMIGGSRGNVISG